MRHRMTETVLRMKKFISMLPFCNTSLEVGSFFCNFQLTACDINTKRSVNILYHKLSEFIVYGRDSKTLHFTVL